MARLLRIYQGEDQTPVTDITDMVEWPDCEFGQRAYFGEGSLSKLRFRDEDGRTGSSTSLPAGLTPLSIAAHNVVTWTEGSNTMFRGRVSPKDYTRGEQVTNRAREVDISLDDYNKDLHNIIVHDWVRAAETDVARVQALAAAYLAGSPRVTTNLSTTYVNAGSNTVSLPAFTYDRTTVHEVLTEIARTSDKQLFVTIDGQLFYDGNDSTAYQCPFKISDRDTEVNNTTVFAPIWDLGPASTEDGAQLLSGLWLFYSENQYVHVTNATIANAYSWWEDIIYDDTVQTASAATQKANAILARRSTEDRTYQVSIGPLSLAQWGSIKHGQTIQIKARAIPDADDLYVTRRITELRWTAPEPERLFAHLTLDRPLKNQAYGHGDKPDTIAQPPPVCNPDIPGTPIYNWTWTTNNLDDGTGLISGGLKRPTTNPYYAVADAAFGAQAYGYNTAGNRATQKFVVAGSTSYNFSMDILWQYDPSHRSVTVQWFGTGGTVLLSTDTWILGSGHATNVVYSEANNLTSPGGADRAVIDFSPFAGVYGDNLIVSTAGSATDNNPFCTNTPGSSPFFLPSDAPVLTGDDVHLTTKTQQRVANNSGVTLSAGDVIVPDTSTDGPAVTRTTSASSTAGPVGIVIEGGADQAQVVVQWSGVASFVNTNGTPADGDYLSTSTTAGAANVSATRGAGTFGRVVRDDGSGETLSVLLWGVPDATTPAGGAGQLDWFIVTDPAYGAIGDDTTDDTAAITAAINAAVAAGGGIVYFPALTYKITSLITITAGALQDGIHLMGAQAGDLGNNTGSVIHQATNNTGALLFATNIYQSYISNLFFHGPTTHSSGVGIEHVRNVIYHNVSVNNFGTGVKMGTSSFYSKAYRLGVYNCTTGIQCVNGSNNVDFYACRISTCTTGFSILGTEKVAFYGGEVEACSTGILLDSGSNFTSGVTLSGIYFENSASAVDVRVGDTTEVRGVVISGCKFTAHSGGFHIDAQNVVGLQIVGNDFRKTTGTAIRTQSPATGVISGPNRYAAGTSDSFSGNARLIDPETDTAPVGTGTAASPGTSRYFPRIDHVHTNTVLGALTVSGTPVSGDEIIATSATTATWQTPSASSGGGDDHIHLTLEQGNNGDGATTIWTLINIPEENQIMPFVNGVMTPAFTHSVDQVTFTVAPANLATVYFTYIAEEA